MKTITVLKQSSEMQIPVNGTILDSLERNGVQIDSMCRTGFCGACKTKKLRGDVKYIDEPLGCFNEAEEILPCVCVVESDDVLLEVR